MVTNRGTHFPCLPLCMRKYVGPSLWTTWNSICPAPTKVFLTTPLLRTTATLDEGSVKLGEWSPIPKKPWRSVQGHQGSPWSNDLPSMYEHETWWMVIFGGRQFWRSFPGHLGSPKVKWITIVVWGSNLVDGLIFGCRQFWRSVQGHQRSKVYHCCRNMKLADDENVESQIRVTRVTRGQLAYHCYTDMKSGGWSILQMIIFLIESTLFVLHTGLQANIND